MSIILDTQAAGVPRRIVMRTGQVATFGTDVWTDFSFPADSGLAARHFRLDCRNDRCELSVLEDRSEIFHNEMPVRSAQLRSGDRLSVGQTLIRVQFGGLESNWSTGEQPAESPKFTMTTAEACHGVDLDPEVAAIVNAHPDPPQAVGALIAEGYLAPAIRVLAAVLPPRAATWWMLSALQRAETSLIRGPDAELKDAIQRWIVTPTESQRRYVETLIPQGDRSRPSTWLAYATFWSGQSLAPPALDNVAPPKHLTGTGVATAAMLVASQNPITMSSTMEQILHLGRNILDGQHPWPTA